MTRDVIVANPRQTICEAACMMAKCDSGSLPVGDGDRLVGFITDRDIALRAVAKSLPPDTPVSEVMSREVLYCYEDENIDHVAQNMGAQQIRRLPVLNRAKRLVGIVSIGDIAGSAAPSTAGLAVADISRPGGRHDQTGH
jgi:CBS domain-containing protein